MTGIFYTTNDVKAIFLWKSDNTVYRKIKSGFLPKPDLPGNPNKWRKSTINAIVSPGCDTSVDPDFGTKSSIN